MKSERIYVAGSYSADNVIEILDNIRVGMRVSTQVLLKGHSPFCPWLDFHFNLMLRKGEVLTVEDFYRYSIAWLDVSDSILILHGSDDSKGTQKEIFRAEELDLKFYFDIKEVPDCNSTTT